MITSLRNKSYEERLAQLKLFSLEKRRLQGKISECFNMLNGFTNVDVSSMFPIDRGSRARSNGVKLRCKRVQMDCTKFSFANDVIRELNNLLPSVMQCDTKKNYLRTNRTPSPQSRYPIKSKFVPNALQGV